jgi:hypothetical protein
LLPSSLQWFVRNMTGRRHFASSAATPRVGAPANTRFLHQYPYKD